MIKSKILRVLIIICGLFPMSVAFMIAFLGIVQYDARMFFCFSAASIMAIEFIYNTVRNKYD